MKLKKRDILIAIVTILSTIHSYNINAQTTSQDSIVCTQFEKDFNAFSIRMDELEKPNKKDYIALSKLYNNFLAKYEKLSTPLQKKYDYVKNEKNLARLLRPDPTNQPTKMIYQKPKRKHLPTKQSIPIGNEWF